jgi:hypothetical protein
MRAMMKICRENARRAGLALAAWGLIATAPGCGGGSLPPPSDPEQARQVLISTLDAWKRGERPGAGGVRVLDRDWESGRGLIDFEITGAGEPLGLALRCPVTLTLRDEKGKPRSKRVVYTVSTGTDAVVARQDLDF